MNLSTRTRRSLCLAVGCLSVLAAAQPASAQYVNSATRARGFEVSQRMQSFWQQRERAASRESLPPAPVAVATVEPRYVTVVGPDGVSRTFEIEGPITVVPVRSTVVHFGANNPEGQVVWMPAEPTKIRYGANTPEGSVVYLPAQPVDIHFGANNSEALIPAIAVPARKIYFGANH